jgi:murein DD-endopeptidase MepM/ murein hydrolase activator NlpD
LLTALLAISYFVSCTENEPDFINDNVLIDEYGNNIDSMMVISDSVSSNQTISSILSSHRLSQQLINEIIDSSKKYYDLTLLRIGNKFSFYFSEKNDSSMKMFVYEINPVEYCVVDLTNGVRFEKREKESVTVERTAFGKITSSLYKTLNDASVSPELAIKLSEIFAWEIDFYRLQENDFFKVIYEEVYVNGKMIGIKKILAAEFFHADENYYAFAFSQDIELQYFNEEGKSLRKQFLQSPLKFSRITSGFSMHRFHPVQKIFKAHLGTDYAAPTGTPILAIGDGTVIEAAYKPFNGNYVKIRHNSTYTTQYLHMSNFAKGIRSGVHVSQGQIIGYVGSTGLATGPHVCFRFWKNNQQVDHRKEKFPSSYPVADNNIEEFNKIKSHYLTRLNEIQVDENPIKLASN